MDIGRRQVGRVYAKALLSATVDKGSTETVLSELGSLVNDVFDKSPRFDATLASPRLSPSEKIEILERTVGSRVSSALLRFLKVTCEHGRLDCLREIHEAACQMRNQALGVVEVEMVTADEVDSLVVERVKQALTAKLGSEVQLRAERDPRLIGGVLVRVGDKVYDASVSQKLRSLRHEAVTKTVRQMREQQDRFAVN